MKKTLVIEGMSCPHCSRAVEKALGALPGVTSAVVDLAAKTATVEAENTVEDAQLTKAVTDAGYEVTAIR